MTTSQPRQISLANRMIVGGAIGLAVISVFIFPIADPNPAWGKFWRIQPLVITPFAGAMGGLCNYVLLNYHHRFGVSRIAAVIVSIIVFVVGLWLGIVLGLNGTLWD